MRIGLLLFTAIAMVLGCGSSSDNSGGDGGGGGGGGGSLDCAWLESDNCWKTTTSGAQSCLPPSTATGSISADNSTCTYASGQVVTFTPALTLPLPDSPTWNFTVTSAGQTCLHYQETASGSVSLTVGSETFKETVTGTTGLRFTCPDGTSYANSNAFDLLNCPGGLTGMPGNAWGASDTSVSFAFIGTSSSSSLSVFDCTKP